MVAAALAACLAVSAGTAAAQEAWSFRDRAVFGGGFDVMVGQDWAIPMAGIHVARLHRRFVLPALDVSALWLPGGIFGVADLGAGPMLESRDGRLALLLRAGPSVAAGYVAEAGSGGVVGAHASAGLLVRVSGGTALRLDVSRRLFRNAYGRPDGAWGFGVGFTGISRLQAGGLR